MGRFLFNVAQESHLQTRLIEPRRCDATFIAFFGETPKNFIRNFDDHFIEQHAEVAALAEIRWRNVFHPLGMCRQLEAFAEAVSRFVARIVNRDAVTTVSFHQGEARNVSRTIADIDHILKWHRALFGRHMVIHILAVVEHPFVDAEKVLRLGGVTDDPTRKSNNAVLVLCKLTTKNRFDMRRYTAAIEQGLQATGHDVVLHLDTCESVLVRNHSAELFKKIRHAWIELKIFPQGLKILVCRAVDLQIIEHHFEIRQLAVVPLLLNQGIALLPELLAQNLHIKKA